jgi:hypothetical protein
MLLSMDTLIPWIEGDVVDFDKYAERAGLDPDEVSSLLLYGLPTLPPAPGEEVMRVSVPHADRWRAMFAVWMEGLGGDGYSKRLGREAHRLRGLPVAR